MPSKQVSLPFTLTMWLLGLAVTAGGIMSMVHANNQRIEKVETKVEANCDRVTRMESKLDFLVDWAKRKDN